MMPQEVPFPTIRRQLRHGRAHVESLNIRLCFFPDYGLLSVHLIQRIYINRLHVSRLFFAAKVPAP